MHDDPSSHHEFVMIAKVHGSGDSPDLNLFVGYSNRKQSIEPPQTGQIAILPAYRILAVQMVTRLRLERRN